MFSRLHQKGVDAPDPARPDRVDLYLRLAGHSRTVQTCPVYVTGNPGGKFARHLVGIVSDYRVFD
jgi:hypothetical protein